ncbi:hypothetical protein [Mesomycoplasma molare]|uniref:Uncharacterized protein n=1 Tax=Mesomycoplasma molare TaxID=171288 RepID=A0ABY5TUP9_9BACT|nr:hypothetical protein [Mesomycoplasma molare]UWD34064.1 hypothetical protein NX772_03080 [Mesomycoplasma molare]
MEDQSKKMTLTEFFEAIDKESKPIDELLKENGDWDELVRVMNALAKL